MLFRSVESITTLGINSKLIVFEAYEKRYLVILSPNNTTLVDSYNITSFKSNTQESFKELLKTRKTEVALTLILILIPKRAT